MTKERFLTLPDETEIVHSEVLTEDEKKSIKNLH